MIIQGCFDKEIRPSKANGNRVSHRVVQRSYNTLIKDSNNCQKQYSTTTRAQADTTLTNEGLPPRPDVAAAHLARALIPFLLGETKFLKNQLEKALVFLRGPVLWSRRSVFLFLCHLDGGQRRVWVDG